MSKSYFHKNGRVALPFPGGKTIPFTALGDARSVAELDDTEQADMVAYLDGLIKDRIGGVSRITEEACNSLKKNLPFDPSLTFARQSKARLFSVDALLPKSVSAEESARSAKARAGASPAEVASLALAAGAQESSRPPIPSPVSRGRKIRTGRITENPNDGTLTVSEQPAQTAEPASEVSAAIKADTSA